MTKRALVAILSGAVAACWTATAFGQVAPVHAPIEHPMASVAHTTEHEAPVAATHASAVHATAGAEIARPAAPHAEVQQPTAAIPRVIELRSLAPMQKTLGTAPHELNGKMFNERIRFRDPLQGQSADCYFVAAMAAVAQRSPDLIRSAVVELPGDKIRVRFYEPKVEAGVKKYTPVDVIIDRKVPGMYGKPAYAKGVDATQWPSLVEKAYASFRGGYDAIGNGGRSADALEALTGRPTVDVVVTPTIDRAKMVEAFRVSVAEGRPVLASTRSPEEFAKTMTAVKASGANKETYERLAAIADPTGPDAEHAYGLSGWHVYTVLGVGRRNGEDMIVLRNPWGYFEPGRNGLKPGEVQKSGGNGVFAIRADEFAMIFNGATIGDKTK